MGLQTDQPSQGQRDSKGQHAVTTAVACHSVDMGGAHPANRQHRRLSEDIASTSERYGEPAAAVSLSEISFYHEEPVTVSVIDQAATNCASDFGAHTSNNMPCSEAVRAARGGPYWPSTSPPQLSENLTPSAFRGPAEHSRLAQQEQHQLAFVPGQDPAARASQQSSPRASLELGANPARLPNFVPAAPSLQSWANAANDQCGLASKSASLDTSSIADATSPRISSTFPTMVQGDPARAGPELVGSPQQADRDEAGSAARHAHAESSSASQQRDNAPAFWEGARRSSSGSGHVHGSSAALSALAQAYSRAGQDSPKAAQKPQDAQVTAIGAGPLEVSELLRAMAVKIDSQARLQDTNSPPSQAATGACNTPSDLESKGRTAEAVSHNAPQKEPASEHWPSAAHSGPPNPFAAACEQAEQESTAQVPLSQEPGSQAGAGSATLAPRDGDTVKSVAALSMCAEAGSCIATPAAQGSPFHSAQSASQSRSLAPSSPDSWSANAALCATARGGPASMLAGTSSGIGTPLDRSQHSAGRSRLAALMSSQVSARCQPSIHEGVWDSGRSQPQGTCTSAPTSGSIRKSSALEDSAKESICPAELDNLEKAWLASGGGASAVEKLRQQALWQKQALVPRDSMASASQADPYASFKGARHMQRTQSASKRSDQDASCEAQAGSRVPLSRSGRSGLSATGTPVGDAGNLDSRDSAGSRLTTSNLTELDSLQRQISRKDKPRSPLHERTHAWLAQAELPAEFEHSAKRAAKLKERCDSYTARMSNPFETRRAAGEGPGPSPRLPAASPGKKPNFLKRFIACITIEPCLEDEGDETRMGVVADPRSTSRIYSAKLHRSQVCDFRYAATPMRHKLPSGMV